jgi:hypothetical protein
MRSSSYAVQRVLDRYDDLQPRSVEGMLRYRTFVSIPRRYMYVEVPKAACTGMKWLLHKLENGKEPKPSLGETRREMFIHSRENVPLPSLVDLDETTQKYVLESPDVLRMMIVRNPHSRIVSTWRNKVLLCEPGFDRIYVDIRGEAPAPDSKPAVSLKEFVRYLATDDNLSASAHWAPQGDHAFFRALNYSFVGRVEQLADTLRVFQLHLGRSEPLALEWKNPSMALGQATYDAEVVETIARLYRNDFEAFGYDPKVWPFQEQGRSRPSISEETFRDEIIERNIIISQLAAECARLQHLHHRATRYQRRLRRFLRLLSTAKPM